MAGLACVMLGMAGGLSSVAADPSPPSVKTFDRWYAVYLADQRVGWSRATVETVSDPPSIVTSTQIRVTVRRGQVQMSIEAKNRFVETPDGRPIRAESRQQLGRMGVSQTLTFNDDGVELVTLQGGQETRRKMPMPRVPGGGSWLPPAAAHRYVERQMADEAEEFSCWTLDPSMGTEPFRFHVIQKGSEDVEVLGKIVPAIVWDTKISVLPGITSRQYVDDQGREVKTTMRLMPGMELSIIEADRELALAAVDPPELMASTLLRSHTPIRDPRSARRVVYELGYRHDPSSKDQAGVDVDHWVVHGGYQAVRLAEDGRSARVVVDLDRPVGVNGAGLGAGPGASCLQPNVMLRCDDPQIVQLVASALAGLEPEARTPGITTPGASTPGVSAVEKAMALRRFVSDHVVEKDLSVGFATASEVARTGQGDCTEHAVLLAAMLRAAGIPCRVVSGLIYVDEFLGQRQVFGYHMWTQAWIPPAPTPGPGSPALAPGGVSSASGAETSGGNGYWMDLDATLPGAHFDAAHIALATSDLADEQLTNDIVVLARMIGRLEIRVVEQGGGDPHRRE